MKDSRLRIFHVNDGTTFGYDMTEDGRRVWYFIQLDIFGDGSRYGIWNPDNRLRSYASFKEALIYQAIANEDVIFPKSKAYIVRGFCPTDFKNIERVTADNEKYYYG
ncbi:hypothetical protein [Herbinix luporum]|uniref:hypothetical protein n=1 Tax=Herbinix luporum TaxID=1679721 RepID=UPI0023F3E843|nr:hypothetical protein [Herbinix luporum]